MPGPAPKRSEQRRRTNAPARELVKPSGAAPAPELVGRDSLHPLAAGLWDALVTSAEAKFYTAAIWQRALVHVHMLDATLNGEVTAAMYATIQADWKSLLIDPAEQRRLGIEVQAAAVEVNPDEQRADATVVSIMDRLQQGA